MTVSERESTLTGTHFMLGDIACAEGALAAGCRFFGGYPITPATEIAERMSERLPDVGGIYIQMEDELASIAAVLGASWAGVRAMTATSGPGFSLMMENLGLGIMTETPCVVVNVQRGGPSTGLPTAVGHGEMMQARWGTHGHYEVIALCPSSPQEFFDLTVTAFNLAEEYRTPVVILADEVVGHMTERVVISEHDQIKRVERKNIPATTSEEIYPYAADGNGIPPMVCAGAGHHIHITGLTHDEKGYPAMNEEAQTRLVQRLVNKIRDHRDEICMVNEEFTEDAEVVVVAYGILARMSALPVRWARETGLRVGMLRPITVWPFPERRIRELSHQVKAFVVPELNLGQMVLEVERCAGGRAETILLPNAGGGIHDPTDVFEAIRSAAK